MKKIVVLFFLLFSLSFAREMSLTDLKALCFSKNTESCNIVADWYISQQDSLKNALKEARVYFMLSCKFGNPRGCFEVGNFYSNGQVGLKIKNAAKAYFEVSCLGGYADACFQLGSLYAVGIDSYKTHDKAFYYFKKACFFGSEDGCLNYNLILKNNKN